MNCADAELHISLAAAGALEGQERAELDRHLEGCAACARQLEQSRALLERAELPPLTLKDHAQLSQLSRAPRVHRRWVPQFAALAAGLLAVLLAGKMIAPRTTHHRATPAAQLTHAPAMEEAVADDSLDLSAFSEDDLATADGEPDSALYDAVSFEGGDFAYAVDNG